jgi:hypothetical protein
MVLIVEGHERSMGDPRNRHYLVQRDRFIPSSENSCPGEISFQRRFFVGTVIRQINLLYHTSKQ